MLTSTLSVEKQLSVNENEPILHDRVRGSSRALIIVQGGTNDFPFNINHIPKHYTPLFR